MSDETVRCPSCRIAMRRTELAGIEIDECPACDGLWLDRDEPEHLATLDILKKNLLAPMYFEDERKQVPPGQRCCPRQDQCGLTVMEEVHHRGVRIDVCPRCRGVFLDRWELQQLLQE